MSTVITYRDVRPDGTVLSMWSYPEGQEYGLVYYPGPYPAPPYERQRYQGGEWVTVGSLDAAGAWQVISPT